MTEKVNESNLTVEIHNGIEIWIADYSNMIFDEVSKHLELNKKRIINSGKTDIIMIDIVNGTKMNRSSGAALKDFANTAKPYLMGYAAVGVSGLSKVFVSAVRLILGYNEFKVFQTLNEAIEHYSTLDNN